MVLKAKKFWQHRKWLETVTCETDQILEAQAVQSWRSGGWRGAFWWFSNPPQIAFSSVACCLLFGKDKLSYSWEQPVCCVTGDQWDVDAVHVWTCKRWLLHFSPDKVNTALWSGRYAGNLNHMPSWPKLAGFQALQTEDFKRRKVPLQSAARQSWEERKTRLKSKMRVAPDGSSIRLQVCGWRDLPLISLRLGLSLWE